jgi:hypothetical protein
MNVQQFRAVTYLKNTGESREMLRVVQARKDAPPKRIFRMLAELGVPCSMTEELVGHRLDEWDDAPAVAKAKLQTLWALAEAYMDVIRRLPGALEALPDVVLEAQQWGVWYPPPAATWAIIERKRALALPEHEQTVRLMLALPEVVRFEDLPRASARTREEGATPRKHPVEKLPRTFPAGDEMVRIVRLWATGMAPWRIAWLLDLPHSTVGFWAQKGTFQRAYEHLKATQPSALHRLPDPVTGDDPHPFETVEGAGRLAPPKFGGRGPKKGNKYP